jgi:hypothetical protein
MLNLYLKKTLFLLIIFFSTISYSQTKLGSGSYTTNFPGSDSAGRNEFPSGTPQLSGNALNRANSNK